MILKQGDVVPTSAWRQGIIWTWWTPPDDLKGRTPLGWAVETWGAVFAQFAKPIGGGEILILGAIERGAQRAIAPAKFAHKPAEWASTWGEDL